MYLSPKFRQFNKSKGSATLIVTLVLLITTTLMIFFAANQGRVLTQIASNQYQSKQAFAAAEAGLSYAVNYLQQNASTILANPVSGHIPSFSNSLTSNVALTDGSKYTFTYTNPVANNYNLITITSTGTSSDGTSTRVLSQQVQFGSVFANPPNFPLTSIGSIAVSGSATITNTSGTATIASGSTVSLSGSAKTVNSGGTSSTAGNIKSDITQNSTSISSESATDFFASYFGTNNPTNVQNKMAHVYSNSSSTNYSSTLNGMSGTSIWINQTGGTASINGNTTIGSPTNPVLLIINGDVSISGGVTIYGFVYITGTTGIDTITGNVNITGGLVNSNQLSMSGNIALNFNPSLLTTLQKQSNLTYYAVVPGSWKDF